MLKWLAAKICCSPKRSQLDVREKGARSNHAYIQVQSLLKIW